MEWTSGSDVDWTFLIDGPADPEHFRIAQDIASALCAEGFPAPGPTETFGSLSNSHDLIHHIGGLEDSNQNMTRRVLLLLESMPLTDGIAHGRVVRQILKRYIVTDPAVSTVAKPVFQVPLFLLNDVVRMWRTFAVDYATKKWQRAGKGWALRNIKLRMSRKVLFVKGMLMCFDCSLNAPDIREADPETVLNQMVSHCFELTTRPAIDILCDVLQPRASAEVADEVLSAYDTFLGILNEEHQRTKLKGLSFEEAAEDELFQQLRATSHRFRDALENLFFDEDPSLAQLTRRYGVF